MLRRGKHIAPCGSLELVSRAMNEIVAWLEIHDKLAGWAQFVGAVLALGVTYFTAFVPVWRRKRRLREAAKRLLANGYEVIESYHRTSGNFAVFPISLRQTALSMTAVVDEVGRFPVFELDDHGPGSLARRLTAMSFAVSAARLLIETAAADLDGRTATDEENQNLRTLIGEHLTFVQAIVTGADLKRPEWKVAGS